LKPALENDALLLSLEGDESFFTEEDGQL